MPGNLHERHKGVTQDIHNSDYTFNISKIVNFRKFLLCIFRISSKCSRLQPLSCLKSSKAVDFGEIIASIFEA